MKRKLVFKRWMLTKNGERDISWSVACDASGRESPCMVTVDGFMSMIGGSIQGLEEIFRWVLANNPDYTAREVHECYLLAQ